MTRTALSLGIVFFAGCSATLPPPPPQLDGAQLAFSQPEQAVEALKKAAAENDESSYLRIFGPEAKDLLKSGDEVADKVARENFARAVGEKVQLETAKLDAESGQPVEVALLSLGADEWPFPVPLVKQGSSWKFDTLLGKEEILDRRVGENELTVLHLCDEYVSAQQEYAATDHEGIEPGSFASRLVSTPGKHDGLYWEGEPQSPLGALIAGAEQLGYAVKEKASPEQTRPFFGYYFRVLTKQGKHARGGEMDYMKDGKLTEGFALIAYPANWGNTGVMTFVVGPDGVIYQKNLGPDTAEIASRISEFDPDLSWDPA